MGFDQAARVDQEVPDRGITDELVALPSDRQARLLDGLGACTGKHHQPREPGTNRDILLPGWLPSSSTIFREPFATW